MNAGRITAVFDRTEPPRKGYRAAARALPHYGRGGEVDKANAPLAVIALAWELALFS